MATEVQNGRAHVHGIRNDGTEITILGYASFTLQSVNGNHRFVLDEIEDELGFHKALVATNAHIEATIVFLPSAVSTTNTRANAEGVAVFLAPLAKVTITHMAIAMFNGDWVYIGDESIDLTHKQGSMNLKLRKYADATQNTSLTTTV